MALEPTQEQIGAIMSVAETHLPNDICGPTMAVALFALIRDMVLEEAAKQAGALKKPDHGDRWDREERDFNWGLSEAIKAIRAMKGTPA